MSMIKVITSDSYDFGEEPAQLIKRASSGLQGDDLRSFIKRAGHFLADELRRLDFAPGEVPVHLIALGATEYFSANRNGDGFKEASCQKFHDTFEKFARFYRNHENTNPARSYGIIKKSYYNPEMHRIELIVALNGTKEAAAKNGGLLADEELELLENHRPMGVSMSCVLDPDAPIRTQDGYRGISRLQAGDQVFTHLGNWQKVIQPRQRSYTGVVVRLVVQGLPEPLLLTADHMLFGRWHSGGRHQQPSWQHVVHLQRRDLLHGWDGHEIVYYKIKEVSTDYVTNRTVYNLEVENDESYLLHGVSSHNCKVAHDVCSWCKNKARTRKEYCDENSCGGGGLKHNIGSLLKCGHVLHADNPEPLFFDISKVVRPADRTAYVTGVLHKAAGGAQLAEELQITLPEVLQPVLEKQAQERLLEELTQIQHVSPLLKQAMAVVGPALEVNAAETRPAHRLTALADAGAILPLPAFLDVFLGDTQKTASCASLVRGQLPGVYQRLSSNDELDKMLAVFSPGSPLSERDRRWAAKYAADYSFTEAGLRRRLQRAAFQLQLPPRPVLLAKQARSAQQLADLYGAYTLAALARLREQHVCSDLTAQAVLAQNMVS